MEWDDLRLALAVAEAGTAARAGKRLGVAHTTVTRRLAELERAAGTRFFERDNQRLVPTEAGREVLALAEDFAKRLDEVKRSLRDTERSLDGVVTITAPELVASYIATRIGDLRERHPGIRLRLLVSAAELDLAREADIAVRVAAAPKDDLVGQRVGFAELAVYGTKALALQEEARESTRETPWVCFDDPASPQARWEAHHVPADQVALRTSSRATFIEAVRAGVGVGLLPTSFADREPSLVRRGEVIPELRASVWVLTHPRAKGLARVRAVASFLADTLRSAASGLGDGTRSRPRASRDDAKPSA